MHSRTNVVSAVAVTVRLANVVASAAASVVKAAVARVAKVLHRVQAASAVSAVKAAARAVMMLPRRAVVSTTTPKRVKTVTLL